MESERLLRNLKDDTDFGRIVQSVESRTKMLRLACVLAWCLCLTGGVWWAASAVTTRERAPMTASEVVDMMIVAAHSLPEGSCELASAARFLMSCVQAGDPTRHAWIELAVPGVARAGLGMESEPWLRACLVNPSLRVRRAAVAWYPVAVPDFRSNPGAAADFDAAVRSINGE